MTLMVFLFMSEFSEFVKIKTSSEMLVDTKIGSDNLKINIDVVMNRLPCHIVSIDSQDVTGQHTMHMIGMLNKYRLSKTGARISEFKAGESSSTYEEVKKAVQNEEGCHIVGNISVLKVPGNFHISSHSFGSMISKLVAEGVFKFDISHKINHISFGDESDISYIQNNFNVGILNPLDGVSRAQSNENKIYEYYLKVVPTSYTDVRGNNFNVHQFTANNNEVKAHMLIPTIFFRYDISPILVKIVQYKESTLHFLVQICAIVGGMFTVMGILDNLIYRLTRGASKSD